MTEQATMTNPGQASVDAHRAGRWRRALSVARNSGMTDRTAAGHWIDRRTGEAVQTIRYPYPNRLGMGARVLARVEKEKRS